jgi:hypothetical protein
MKSVLNFLVTVVQVALALLAVALLAGASWRNPTTISALSALVFLVGTISMVQSWRRGHLRMSPKQLTGEVMAGRHLDTPLMMVSFWLGVISLSVCKFS